MADFRTKAKVEELSQLLKQAGCDEYRQIMELVDSIVGEALDETDSYKDEINKLYKDIFFSRKQEHEIVFEAYRLGIKDSTGRIILIDTDCNLNSEKIVFESIAEMLETVVESKTGQNHLVHVRKGLFAIVYEIAMEDDARDFSLAIVQSLMNEFGIKINIGIGNAYNDVSKARNSYHEAEVSMQAGRLLFKEQRVCEYRQLGLAKIVYEITEEQCRDYVQDFLTEEAQKELENKEMSESIELLFKNDLNISLAARELYIHRNTLVYRIEKFNKISGYNLLNFEDAAVIRLALMARRRNST